MKGLHMHGFEIGKFACKSFTVLRSEILEAMWINVLK